ncbi:MAG: hypothetical protein QJR03_02590 [Sphaerobacter sp.]|nr:hypothetical protein [Sphaerobacter sp.]
MRVRVIVVLLVAAAAVLLPGIGGMPAARAAEFRSGPSPSLAADARVNDDLYITGGTVTVNGQVTQDLLAAGGTVTVNGPVDGNVNIAGGTVTITGPVGGTVRVAGGSVTIDAAVARDVVVTAGTATISASARVGQDLIVGSGMVAVDGPVGRDVRGGAGDLRINNTVGRDVRVDLDGRLTLGSNARIQGDLRYSADAPATMASGATVTGTTIYDRPPEESSTARVLRWLRATLLRLAWALLAGTALVLLLPRTTRQVTDTLRERPAISLGWGVGALIIAPILAILLAVTVIGVPLALILLGLYLLALYLSQVVVGITLGRVLVSGRELSRVQLWLAMLIGVTVVVLFRLLPIPFGWSFWVSLIIACLALGAIWTTLTGWGRHRAPPSAPEAPPAGAAPPVA